MYWTENNELWWKASMAQEDVKLTIIIGFIWAQSQNWAQTTMRKEQGIEIEIWLKEKPMHMVESKKFCFKSLK